MSKTYRIIRGEKYTRLSERCDRHPKQYTKYMGMTDGSHTLKDYLRDDNGNIVKPEVVITLDKVAIKGVDFIKYGYGRHGKGKYRGSCSMHLQPKTVVEYKHKNKILTEELNEYYNGN